MARVFVCAGMGLAKNENINLQAKELGRVLGQDKSITYVQGGSDEGLMGETLKEFLKYSSNVEFYIPEAYYDYNLPTLLDLVGKENFKAYKTHGETGRLNVVKSCDHIIVLPGGTGTLLELLYCNETLRSGEHSNKLTLLNIDGYFDGLLQQIKTNVEQGISKPSAIRFDIITDVNQLSIEKVNKQTL